jgi:glutamyl/glutaminyl-tRNA synthetase
MVMLSGYRGRIAPTPTGHLHLGHAATFWRAFQRAREAGGTLIWRTEDLDPFRCKKEFADAAMEDLRWLGIRWQEGPDVGGHFGPYEQSARRSRYLAAWRRLKDGGWIYPCTRSRREVAAAAGLAPHEEEPIFPVAWRGSVRDAPSRNDPRGVNGRFRVPDHDEIRFEDGAVGPVVKRTLQDFGDFLVWNRDDIPAYELAVVVDDLAMEITEVVRGEDLLTSTARQLLIYRALGATPPAFFHTPLVRDAQGRRLAKRDAALSLRTLRESGRQPKEVLAMAGCA